MKTSLYFSERLRSYQDEIDDLLSDSEGRTVLQRRLKEKRGEIDAILPMIEYSPEMVAVIFYEAFEFRSVEALQRLVQNEPEFADFPRWKKLAPSLALAGWAEPLVAATLKVEGGDAFLVTTAGLEFLRGRGVAAPLAPETEDAGDADDDEVDDLGDAGSEWLTEQGFENLEQ